MTRSRKTGRGVPVEIVGPQWTRAELRDIVRGEAERGWLTRGQARRIIARDKAAHIMDGPGSRELTPRTRTRRRSR